MGMLYLNWRLRQAMRANEGYGTGHTNEPEQAAAGVTVHPLVAILPLLVVGVSNWAFTKHVFPAVYMPDPNITTTSITLAGLSKPIDVAVRSMIGIWSVEVALVLGILTVLAFAFRTVASRFAEGSKQAIAGSLLAAVNTASEYGFGAVIAALPGFLVIRDALKAIPDPLVNEAIAVTTLAGITGSASGGMSIALAAMAQQFKDAATASGIPMEVLHRVASMASGGMDTLPHNGAVITLLMVTGLTHRTSYKDIFAITCIKTSAVFVVIALYYLTGLV